MLDSLSTSYCGPAPLPDDLWGRWNLDPWLIAALLLGSALYWMHPASQSERRAFMAALAVLALVFISPLCALTVALFSARVVHHVLLVAVAAPLLAHAVFNHRALASLLTPLTLLHTAIFWAWHAPDAYAAALSYTSAYWAMQITLLASATALWGAIFAASSARAIAALLFLTIQMGLLGALLVFSASPLYAPHLATTLVFGLDPLSDQQLAGLIMWVPASLPYVGFALWRLLMLLRAPAGQGA